MLRKLLDGGKFTVTPIRGGNRVGFKFSGRVSLGRLLAGTALDPGSSMLVGYNRRWHKRSPLRFTGLHPGPQHAIDSLPGKHP